MSSTTSTNQLHPIDKQKYHSASIFYLFCKQFVDENEIEGRKFRTENQGIETASFKWNSMSKVEQSTWHEFFKTQMKEASSNDSRKYKIRNGSKRDAAYDPFNLAKLKDLTLKREKDSGSVLQRWHWSYDNDVTGVANEKFIIVNAQILATASNEGAFKSLAVVEFCLSRGIVEEYHVVVDRCLGGIEKARNAAIERVLQWPLKNRRSLGESTPAFYAPPGQLETVFKALTYVDENTTTAVEWSDLEKTFSLLHDLADVAVLIRAFNTWFGNTSTQMQIPNIGDQGGMEQTQTVDNAGCCLTTTRNTVQNILNTFGILK